MTNVKFFLQRFSNLTDRCFLEIKSSVQNKYIYGNHGTRAVLKFEIAFCAAKCAEIFFLGVLIV